MKLLRINLLVKENFYKIEYNNFILNLKEEYNIDIISNVRITGAIFYKNENFTYDSKTKILVIMDTNTHNILNKMITIDYYSIREERDLILKDLLT
jgi:hypothetical protein